MTKIKNALRKPQSVRRLFILVAALVLAISLIQPIAVHASTGVHWAADDIIIQPGVTYVDITISLDNFALVGHSGNVTMTMQVGDGLERPDGVLSHNFSGYVIVPRYVDGFQVPEHIFSVVMLGPLYTTQFLTVRVGIPGLLNAGDSAEIIFSRPTIGDVPIEFSTMTITRYSTAASSCDTCPECGRDCCDDLCAACPVCDIDCNYNCIPCAICNAPCDNHCNHSLPAPCPDCDGYPCTCETITQPTPCGTCNRHPCACVTITLSTPPVTVNPDSGVQYIPWQPRSPVTIESPQTYTAYEPTSVQDAVQESAVELIPAPPAPPQVSVTLSPAAQSPANEPVYQAAYEPVPAARVNPQTDDISNMGSRLALLLTLLSIGALGTIALAASRFGLKKEPSAR